MAKARGVLSKFTMWKQDSTTPGAWTTIPRSRILVLQPHSSTLHSSYLINDTIKNTATTGLISHMHTRSVLDYLVNAQSIYAVHDNRTSRIGAQSVINPILHRYLNTFQPDKTWTFASTRQRATAPPRLVWSPSNRILKFLVPTLAGKCAICIAYPPHTYCIFGLHLFQLSSTDLCTDATVLISNLAAHSDRLIATRSPKALEQPSTRRAPLSQSTKIFVWKRDQGKCISCGSRERLEFDHIIPLTKGGSNTARNIQLLCEPCNRSKGSNF